MAAGQIARNSVKVRLSGGKASHCKTETYVCRRWRISTGRFFQRDLLTRSMTCHVSVSVGVLGYMFPSIHNCFPGAGVNRRETYSVLSSCVSEDPMHSACILPSPGLKQPRTICSAVRFPGDSLQRLTVRSVGSYFI